jgi:hypothetical protein
MVQTLLTAWERIRPEVIESSWDIFQATGENDSSDELHHRNDDTEFHPHMAQQDVGDLEERKNVYLTSRDCM